MRELFAETPTPTNKFTHQHHTSVSAPSGDCEVGDRCHVSGYVILHQEFSALRPINIIIHEIAPDFLITRRITILVIYCASNFH